MRLLLDTNVLIDHFARRMPFFDDVTQLLVAQSFGDVELWASGLSFSDIEYILRANVGVERLRDMMSRSRGFLNVCVPTPDDVWDGMSSGWPDLEDFLIAKAAQRIRADYLITRDAKGFVSSPVRALTPAAFLKLMRDDYHVIYEELMW